MKDDDLRQHLERRAGPPAEHVVRRHVLPGVSAVLHEPPPQPVVARGLSPAGALAAVAAVFALVVGLAVARPANAPPGQSPPPTDDVGVAPVTATERAGEFTLTVTASKAVFSADEEIDVVATLAYDGDSDAVTLSGAFDLIAGFSARQLDGPARIGPGWDLPCVRHLLDRDEPVRRRFSDWAAGVELEPGRWELTAIAQFSIGDDCTPDPVRIEASIVIAIDAPVAQATAATPSVTVPASPSALPTRPPAPTPESWLPCDAIPLTLIDGSGLVAECSAGWVPTVPGHSIDIEPVSNPNSDPTLLELTYSVLDPDDCDGERYQLELSAVGESDAPVIIVPSEHCQAWNGDEPSSRTLKVRLALSRAVAADLVVFHEPYVEREYRDEGPILHVVETQFHPGRIGVTLAADREAYSPDESIDLTADLVYSPDFGAPDEPLQVYATFPQFGFVYEQLDGDGRIWDAGVAECAPVHLMPGEPLTAPIDPNVDLTPGRWRVSVTAAFATGSCDAPPTRLHAYVLIHVGDDSSPRPCGESEIEFADETGLVTRCQTWIDVDHPGLNEAEVITPDHHVGVSIRLPWPRSPACFAEPPSITLEAARTGKGYWLTQRISPAGDDCEWSSVRALHLTLSRTILPDDLKVMREFVIVD